VARGWRSLGVALALAFVAAPALFWQGGVIEEEALGFLRNYWGDRSVLQRIFDPRGYDAYQARELSYAVDFLDAQWVRLTLGHGWMWFIPPSALIASLGIVAVWWLWFPRALPGLDALTSTLLLLLYLSNFAALSTAGLLYRSAKPLVAPLFLAALLFVLREHARPESAPRKAFALAFALGLSMSLLDRQGLFYFTCLTVVLGALWLHTRRGRPLALGGGAALVAWLAYNYLFGPWVIHAVNGYWPSMKFQRLRLAWLVDPRPWLEALGLLGDWTSVLLGSLPAAGLAAVGAAAFGAYLWSRRRLPVHAGTAAALALLAVATQLAMVAVMVQRHEPVTWIDHRVWYYPLPFQILLLVGLGWGLERYAIARGGSLPRGVPACLLLLVVANVAQWPERRLVMQSGPWFADVSQRSARLEHSFRTGTPDPRLDSDYRRFFFECVERFPWLAARTGPHVREGAGVEWSEVREGRLFAWAHREAHLALGAPSAGSYRLAGGLWLRPGEAVSLVLRTPLPRLLGEIPRRGTSEGAEFFLLPVQLPPGSTDLMLLSRLPEKETERDGTRVRVAFGLLLPMSLLTVHP